jgi:hypothetical protein
LEAVTPSGGFAFFLQIVVDRLRQRERGLTAKRALKVRVG